MKLLKRYSKIVLQRLELTKAYLKGNSIPVVSFFTTNWGDAVGKHIVSMLSGRPSHIIDITVYNNDYKLGLGNYTNNRKLVATAGSIVHWLPDKCTVWGSGLISDEAKPAQNIDVRAVRGPLTRKVLMNHGISCPEVYGDPALLAPSLLGISAKKNRTFKLGCILHFYHDTKEMRHKLRSKCNPHFISIRSGIRDFLEDISKCEFILSTSLHGLIAADSLNIPSVRLKLDELLGGDFKFNDYEASCDENLRTINIADIHSQSKLFDLMPDSSRHINTAPLIAAQPWDEL